MGPTGPYGALWSVMEPYALVACMALVLTLALVVALAAFFALAADSKRSSRAMLLRCSAMVGETSCWTSRRGEMAPQAPIVGRLWRPRIGTWN